MSASDLGDYSRFNILPSLLESLASTINNERVQFLVDWLYAGIRFTRHSLIYSVQKPISLFASNSPQFNKAKIGVTFFLQRQSKVRRNLNEKDDPNYYFGIKHNSLRPIHR